MLRLQSNSNLSTNQPVLNQRLRHPLAVLWAGEWQAMSVGVSVIVKILVSEYLLCFTFLPVVQYWLYNSLWYYTVLLNILISKCILYCILCVDYGVVLHSLAMLSMYVYWWAVSCQTLTCLGSPFYIHLYFPYTFNTLHLHHI